MSDERGGAPMETMPDPTRPAWAEDLMRAPSAFWQDADAHLQAGTLSTDDYYLLHRQRAEDDANPMLAEIRKGLHVAPAPTPERGDQPTEMDNPEVNLEVTKRPTGERSTMGDVAAGIARGPLVAADETLQFFLATAAYLTGLPIDTQQTLFTRLGPDAPQTTAGGIAQGVSQFVGAVIPTSRAIQAATGLSAIKAGLAASPLVNFFAYDAHDPRLSNLVEEYLPGLSTPVTQYLAADPSDSEAEGRLKNVLENVFVEGAAATVLNGLRFVKQGRAVWRDVRLSESGEVRIPGPEPIPPTLPDTPQSLAQQYADAVIEARRGGPRPHGQVAAEAQALIDSGEVSIDTVRRLLPGATLNDAEAVAVVKVLAESGMRLKVLGAKALETGHPVDIDAFMQQLYLHGAIDPKRIGITTEAGRTLSALNEPTSGLNRFLVQFEELLRNQTAGADPMAMIRAVMDFKDPDQLAMLAKQTSKPGFWDMFKEYYVNGLLWGPKTWLANFVGNTATTVWSIPERGLAGLMGKGEGVVAGEATQMLHGVLGSVADAWRLAAEAFQAEESQFAKVYGAAETAVRQGRDKIELPQRAISAQTLELTGPAGQAVDFLGTLVRFPSRVLAGTDDFFKVINYRAELRAQAYRQASQEAVAAGLEGKAYTASVRTRLEQLLADPPASLKRAADAHALYQTFTNELGETGQALQRVAQTPGGKIIMPFVRTPINIFKYATERTPLGLRMSDVRRDMFGPDVAKAELARAKMALGSMTMGLAGWMAYEGLITGGGPTDPQLRKQLQSLGWQPYSIKLGGKYYSFSRTEPVGMLLGLAADWTEAVTNAEAEGGAEWAGEVGAALVTAVAKNFTSRTFVKGVADTLAAMADPERAAKSRTSGFLASLLPASGLIRQVESAMDPTMAEAQTVLDKVKAQIPGLSASLPVRRDVFGEALYLTGVYGPIAVSDLKDDPVRKELVKVGARTPDVPRTIDGIELTSAERDFWQVQRGSGITVDGKDLHATMAATMASDEYQHASRSHRAFLLELDLRRFQNEAEIRLKEENPIIQRSIDAAREEKAKRREPLSTPEPDVTSPLIRSLQR